MSPSAAPVTQKATVPTASPENQARHQSQPSAISATQSAVKGMPTFEISSPTWISDKDVVLNKPKQVYKSNQSIPNLSHFTTHTRTNNKKTMSLLLLLYSLLTYHFLDTKKTESYNDIFLSISQKTLKTHIIIKNLYIET